METVIETAPEMSGYRISSTLLLSLATLLGYIFFTNFSHLAKHMNQFKGPTNFPIIGSSLWMLWLTSDFHKNYEKAFKWFGRCVRVWVGPVPVMIIGDGEVAQKVLRGTDHPQKSIAYHIIRKIGGQGLLTAPEEKWRKERKQMEPAFAYQHIPGWTKILHGNYNTLVEILGEKFKDGKEQNLLQDFIRCGMEFGYEVMLGRKVPVQRDMKHKLPNQFSTLVTTLSRKVIMPYISLPGVWHLLRDGKEETESFKELRDHSFSLIKELKGEFDKTGDLRGEHTRPLITYMFDYTQDLQEIQYQINTIGGTGVKTVTSSINYLMFLLALNPEDQEKCRDEILSVFPTKEDLANATPTEISKLKYCEMCVKESLRVYQVVPMIGRTVKNDIDLEDGRKICKYTQVIISLYDIHHDPDVFPDPEVFNPERFSEENSKNIKPGHFIPFSTGGRDCIGKRLALISLKLGLAYVLYHFTVSTTCKKETTKLGFGLGMDPHPGIKLKMKPRMV